MCRLFVATHAIRWQLREECIPTTWTLRILCFKFVEAFWHSAADKKRIHTLPHVHNAKCKVVLVSDDGRR